MQRWKHFRQRYEQFVETRGFFLIVGTCVAVIAASAMLSGHTTLSASVAPPTLPPTDASSVARLMQESLTEAQTSTPVPEATPAVFCAPLDTISVLRAFDGERMQYAEETGIWALHDAADLHADAGTPVHAMAPGTVQEVCEKGLNGTSVCIDHGSGIAAEYSSLAANAGLRAGDPVEAGQTIGFCGCTKLDETHLGPHLHLRVTRGGTAIDPTVLWK